MLQTPSKPKAQHLIGGAPLTYEF